MSDSDFAEVTCPDCGANDVELVSLFGGATSEALFYCGRCGSCFTWVKWRHRLPVIPARRGGTR
jgi:uncharacterized Zn finger protein